MASQKPYASDLDKMIRKKRMAFTRAFDKWLGLCNVSAEQLKSWIQDEPSDIGLPSPEQFERIVSGEASMMQFNLVAIHSLLERRDPLSNVAEESYDRLEQERLKTQPSYASDLLERSKIQRTQRTKRNFSPTELKNKLKEAQEDFKDLLQKSERQLSIRLHPEGRNNRANSIIFEHIDELPDAERVKKGPQRRSPLSQERYKEVKMKREYALYPNFFDAVFDFMDKAEIDTTDLRNSYDKLSKAQANIQPKSHRGR